MSPPVRTAQYRPPSPRLSSEGPVVEPSFVSNFTASPWIFLPHSTQFTQPCGAVVKPHDSCEIPITRCNTRICDQDTMCERSWNRNGTGLVVNRSLTTMEFSRSKGLIDIKTRVHADGFLDISDGRQVRTTGNDKVRVDPAPDAEALSFLLSHTFPGHRNIVRPMTISDRKADSVRDVGRPCK